MHTYLWGKYKKRSNINVLMYGKGKEIFCYLSNMPCLVMHEIKINNLQVRWSGKIETKLNLSNLNTKIIRKCHIFCHRHEYYLNFIQRIMLTYIIYVYKRICQWPVTDIGGWPLVNELLRNKKKHIACKIWIKKKKIRGEVQIL